jgi:hypothetical protein
MGGLPHGCRQHRPPLRPDRLLRPLRALPPRLMGAPRGRGVPPPVHPMYAPQPHFVLIPRHDSISPYLIPDAGVHLHPIVSGFLQVTSLINYEADGC